MRLHPQLPYADPGTPDLRSPVRFLLWIARGQWLTIAAGAFFGTVWMLAIALQPAALSRGIDQGIRAGSTSHLIEWGAVMLGLAVITAASGAARHNFALRNWLGAAFRCIQLVGHQAANTGGALPRQMPPGKVVASVSSDSVRLAESFDVTARFIASLVSYAVVSVILLTTSLKLGLVVLIGLPVLLVTLGGVLRPLKRRQEAQREQSGKLTELGADTVAGLRVLRGIGGEETFERRYAAQSQLVREAAVRVATPQATLDSAQVLLPGLFMLIVTWLAARSVYFGEITVGQLVALYGYTTFLVMPLRTATEMTGKFLTSRVCADRIVQVLSVQSDTANDVANAAFPSSGPLLDVRTGIRFEAGRFTAVVCEEPADSAALANRLARIGDDPGDVRYAGVRLVDAPIQDVRSHIVLSAVDPAMFAGTLRDELDPRGRNTDGQVLAALEAVDAGDIIEGLDNGLLAEVEERGRSFSGGQRQRLTLARALLTHAETLVLVEPTSAVDAHTESRIALRLASFRRGQTTIVMTASPLILDQADDVVLLSGGRELARGTHHELLASCPAYRSVVIRGEEEDSDLDSISDTAR